MKLLAPLIRSINSHEGQWDSLEELMFERADIGIKRAFDGFGMSHDEAMNLLRNADNLNDEERVLRDILVAAIDNIVDFSVAEEFRMADEMFDDLDFWDEEFDESDDWDDVMWDDIIELFGLYNDRYVYIENLDIEYAMGIAAFIGVLANDTVLTYMTQRDERVRPWHAIYDGYTVPKRMFPQWLLPPIEHGCRCYLIEKQMSVFASVNAEFEAAPEMPEWFNPTFKESVAMGGRIFSDEHPYFKIPKKHIKRLRSVADKIKSKYHVEHTS